jgi:Cu/Ag efflux pump CusA
MMAAAAVLLFLGVWETRHAAVDALPEFGPARVQVQTEALGLSASEVEQFITVPLEDELNGIAFLDSIHSRSIPGLSAIDLTFKPGTDVLRARQLVTERLAQGPGVANVAAPPVMIQPMSSTSRVMMIGLSARDVSLTDLSTLARWKLKPRLMGVPGVSNVAIWGQRDQQLQVLVDPAKLHANGVTLNQVINTTGNALWSSPLTFVEASSPGSDGFLDTPGQRLPIQHVLPITSPADLAKVAVEDTGDKTIRLGDVTTVVQDHQPLVGDAVVDDGPGILLVVEKLPNANTLDVVRGVQDAIAAMRPGLTGVTVDTTIFQPDSYLDRTLGDLGWAGLAGLLLLVVLLGVALRARAALVSVLTVAVSAAAGAYVLYLRGAPYNVMVLAGLVVALAVIVDEAVVTTLAVRRALGEHRAAGDDRSVASVIVEACAEVRGPLWYATGILVLAVLPVALLSGVPGSFSRPLVVSYLLALGAALAVALTVAPALAYPLLSSGRPAPAPGSGAGFRGRLDGRLDRLVAGSARRPRWAYAILALLLLAGLALVPQLGNHPMLPQLRDRNLVVQWQAAAGTSLPEMDRLTLDASRRLRLIPGVQNVAGEVGRALTSDQVADVNSGELWVTLDPAADYDRTVAAVRALFDTTYPNVAHTVSTYADQRLRAARSPDTPLTVRVYGQDYATLLAEAGLVRDRLASVPGVTNATVRAPATQPSIEVKVDLATAEKYGLKPGDVRRASTTLVNGLPAGSLYQNQQIFDVVVLGQPAVRDSLASIQNLLIDTPSGDQVRLKDLASVQITPTPTVIEHENASRYLDVTADVSGRGLAGAVDAAREALASVPFPVGYHADVFSDRAVRLDAQRNTALEVPAIAVAVLLLLQSAFHDWRRAILLLLALPFAVAGGVPAALLAGGVKSIGALAGLLLVLGIAVRGGVLLIRRYQALEREDATSPGVELVARGTGDRAPAVLLSALTVGLALAPLVALRQLPGGEVLAPLAVTALGGLVSSTLVTLLVLPALYARLVLGHRRVTAEPVPVAAPPPPAGGGQPAKPTAEPRAGARPAADEQPTAELPAAPVPAEEQPTTELPTAGLPPPGRPAQGVTSIDVGAQPDVS